MIVTQACRADEVTATKVTLPVSGRGASSATLVLDTNGLKGDGEAACGVSAPAAAR